jgi:hypothetical protein
VTRARIVAFFVLAVVLCAPAPASAQRPNTTPPKKDRVALYVNYGYLTGTKDVQSTVNFPVNVETGSFTTSFDVKPGSALDIGGRVRVWKHFGVGVGFTSFSANGDAPVTGQIPHPFFFNRPRSVEGSVAMERKETVVHVRAVVSSSASRKLQATAFAGPAFFSVDQTLADKLNYSEAYPFDSATFTSVTTRRVSTSKTGVGVGADLAYYFTRNIGVGLSGTYSKITFGLKAADESTVSVSAGGGIAGLGIRIRF